MVRDGDWKLIFNNSRGIGQPKLDKIYLANLADAQPEVVNHARKHPDVVTRLTHLHQQWIEKVSPEDLPQSAESPP